MYGDQIEMTFHDTVPLPEDQIQEAREKAEQQKAIVLDIFKKNHGNLTPIEVYEIANSYLQGVAIDDALFFGTDLKKARHILLTSIRRSITDLTKEGRLIKCQWSESKQGRYGKLNRTWRYNEYYVRPLNPKK